MEKTFLTEKTKQYLKDHSVNEVLTDAANQMIAYLPDNPWLIFINTFNEHLASSFKVKSVGAKILFDDELFRYIKLELTISFKTKEHKFELNLLIKPDFEPNSILNSVCLPEGQTTRLFSLTEFRQSIQNSLENKEVYSFDSWEKCLGELREGSPQFFSVLSDSFFWMHFACLNYFEPISLSDYCRRASPGFLEFPLTSESESPLIFRLLKKPLQSALKSSKSVFFTVNDASEIGQFKKAKEFAELVLSELKAAKSTASKVAFEDCSLINPFETLAETLKFIGDVVSKVPWREDLRFGLDIEALENLDLSTGKYSIDGSKKPMSDEEFEDFLVKIVGDSAKKIVLTYLGDPFPLTGPLSWHRFNKKLGEKGIRVAFGTRFGAQFDSQQFANLEASNFPQIKPDLFAKILESKAEIKETSFEANSLRNLEQLFSKVRLCKGSNGLGVRLELPEPMSELKWHYLQLAKQLDAKVVVSPFDYLFARKVINNMFA